MKRFILVVVVLLSTFLMQAQDKKPKKTPEQKARNKTNELTTALKLSKEQDAMLYTTHLKYYRISDENDAKEGSKKLKKKRKDVLQDARDKDYKRILTPVQFKQYLALEKEEDIEKKKEKTAKKLEKEKKKAAKNTALKEKKK